MEQQIACRKILDRLNKADSYDFATIAEAAKELLGRSDGAFICPPFHCDYGNHIEVGKNFFANYNCTILDVGRVVIGDNCQMAPNVQIYTAGHPIHPASRNTAYEYGKDVIIGDNVWLGGGCIINPGVRIGSNSIIGAGAVVTKDIPEWSIAVGNPARVIRTITEADRRTLIGKEEIDDEAWADMQRTWETSEDEIRFPTAP
ncbi:MAG: sugar O-acetyltransferase [Firmicutes bacterium]|nr:sugar O-acetyltransferase [Bacillota bacterium]